MRLDEKGRCCGRKPLKYKGFNAARGYFCFRCDRNFDLDTGEQIENYAWRKIDGEWVKRLLNRIDDGPRSVIKGR